MNGDTKMSKLIEIELNDVRGFSCKPQPTSKTMYDLLYTCEFAGNDGSTNKISKVIGFDIKGFESHYRPTFVSAYAGDKTMNCTAVENYLNDLKKETVFMVKCPLFP